MPEKTRLYDPEMDGDGFSKLVPMHVEPPNGSEYVIWKDGTSANHLRTGKWWDGVRASIGVCDGWTFPPKNNYSGSYDAYLDWNGRFILDVKTHTGSHAIAVLSPADMKQHVFKFRALEEFIQDTLAEQEAGE